MAELDLTQEEAEALLAMEKHRADEVLYAYPGMGGFVRIPLRSADQRESFSLDIRRGRLVLEKGTYQTRARRAVILARLDFGGAPHRNPDGAEIGCPHLHLFRVGWGDKWAHALPSGPFAVIGDPWQRLQEFMTFVNITVRPNISQGLFA